MLIALDCGHNAPIADTGARGIAFEDELARQVIAQLKPKLEHAGHEVLSVAPKSAQSTTESLRTRCSNANNAGADLFVSIHFNAFNRSANGTEVFVMVPASKARAQAQDVVDNIAKLGFVNRGVKFKGFYVIKNTKMPAMLIECCFCDSKRDMDLFDPDKMASAIASGLLGASVQPKPPLVDHEEKAILSVTVPTLLKPSTEQSHEINAVEMKKIEVGKYPVVLLADEEMHYSVKFENGACRGEEWFIFQGHCELIDKS